jgi:uncharacterized membrane protein
MSFGDGFAVVIYSAAAVLNAYLASRQRALGWALVSLFAATVFAAAALLVILSRRSR